ncbi:hypothetical protein CK203_115257 [Vitis vinifera]|uniref:Uncharacterized protein n=1 Tax=Vitis vinifera TaxID=29760 RepID=A0A438CBG7_VITVI|nr:hypothetical protein CK203_115257 [Vitis vinifera]
MIFQRRFFRSGNTVERSFSASPSRFRESKKVFGLGRNVAGVETDQRSILKALFLSKGKEKLPNFSKVTREKGLNSGVLWNDGSGKPRGIFLSTFSVISVSFPLLWLGSSTLSPSVPVLPNSAIQSQFPTKPRVIYEIFSKKDDDGAFCLGSVGNPNRDVAVSQLASLNHLSESFKSFKPIPTRLLGPPTWLQLARVMRSPPDGHRLVPNLRESASRLDSPFSEEEIFNAIFQLDRDKAPGPDGFTIAVFQIVGMEEGVVFKIDFEKAYDHVNWDFLDHVLEKKGFSPKWRNWMRGCLSSVSYAILVNGNAKGWVKASRGLRQGRNRTRVSHLQLQMTPSSFLTLAEELQTLKSLLLALLLDCKASDWPILYLGLPLGGIQLLAI